MFTVAQINARHSKVKSGADFPAYIREIKQLGVTFYEVYVTDGHTDYYGAGDYKTSGSAKYETIAIAPIADAARFKAILKAHQQGKTDYPAFCNSSAASGIEKWAMCLDKMTCTYYDKTGTVILVESIPE